MAEEEKKEKKTEKKEGKTEKKTEKKSVLLLIILAVVVVVVIVAGRLVYGKLKETVFENFLSKTTGEVVEIDEEGEKVTVKSGETEFAFEEGGELPENFPEDFPVYPEAKLASSWTAQGEETEGLSLVWETNDSMEKVSEYYKKGLVDAGWKLNLSTEAEDTVTMGFGKDSSSGFLGITTEEGKTIISLTLGVE